MRRAPVLACLSAFLLSAAPGHAQLVDRTADCLSSAIEGAIITNGTIEVGVNCEGHLNTPFPADPLGIGYMGLRYVPTGAASTEPGCQCEGWGVANGAKSGALTNTCDPGNEQGYANVSVDGVVNLIVESFQVSADNAVSVVRVNNGSDLWRVTHDYHPAVATPNLYEVEVTIENLSGVAKPTLYRRVMDWDIYPTPFDEFVTLNPGIASPTAKLYRMDNNGFNSGNPCSFTSYGTTVAPGDPEAADLGPADHGALFDFDFGTLDALGPDSQVNFKTYYGATGDEASAIATVSLAKAENYSFGQPNNDPVFGTPNTFIFAFAGVGAPPVFCGDGNQDPGEQCDDGNNDDGDGCSASCQIEVDPNVPPDCSGAVADPATLWPPNHALSEISVAGVTDEDGDEVTITATSVTQDEAVTEAGNGSGNTSPDASLSPLAVRIERNGNSKTPGNGRVYHIEFTADDGQGGSCEGSVSVCVPHDKRPNSGCVDDRPLYDSIP
jgi:cysteine-rich repeat protein